MPLTNSINECIKKIVRQAYFQFGFKLKKNSSDSFWGLKISGWEEYMYGELPIINYYTVQKLLKDY